MTAKEVFQCAREAAGAFGPTGRSSAQLHPGYQLHFSYSVFMNLGYVARESVCPGILPEHMASMIDSADEVRDG